MKYGLGVDLGTTYTAAAVRTNGHVEVVRLGTRRSEIPSLVFVRPDGEVLVGEVAERRGAAEPARLAREFKRRVGDPVPVLVGGAPYPAHALMARLLQQVVQTVTRYQDTAPSVVTVTHPANWGPYKRELLDQAVRLADLEHVTLRPEPEAAAVQYAATERMRPGEVLAVYDLGGGTFDAAVLRKTDEGFSLLGAPEGIEQLGGIDFDEAVFEHVVTILGDAVAALDPADDAVREALIRMRRDCVEAKEALSFDTEVTIPVALPGFHTRVRLTRAEFESMIGPAITETIGAMRRALRSAGVSATELRTIVLAGGSSRIPLVTQLLATEFDRPVVLDPHPEHAIALGAASVTPLITAPPPLPPPPVGGRTAPAPAERPAEPALATEARREHRFPAGLPEGDAVAAGRAVEPAPPADPVELPAERDPGPMRRGPRRRSVLVAAAAVILLLAAGVGWLVTRDGDAGDAGDAVMAWRRVPDLPVALEGAAVAGYQNRLWVAGGVRNDPARTKITDVYVYDPVTETWTRGPSLPRPISHAALVATPRELYFLGGWVQDGGSRQVLRLDGARNVWVDDVPLPGTRVAGAGVFDGTRILYAGGTRSDGSAGDEIWGLQGGEWEQLGRLQHGRQKLAAASNGVNAAWFLGGRDQQQNIMFGDIDVVSGSNAEVRPDTPMDPPVDATAALRLDGIGLCLVGGQTPTGLNDWWCDQPGGAAKLPKLDPPRAGLGGARIDDTVFVVGGYGKGFDGTARVEALKLSP